jgi:hypothetical protein
MKFQDLALITVDECSDYIRTAAAEFGMSELIVEKDLLTSHLKYCCSICSKLAEPKLYECN